MARYLECRASQDRCWHENRRCVADVSGTFLTLVYIAECVRRMFNGTWRHNIGRKIQCMHWNFSRCPDALAKHGNYSRTSPIIRRTTGAWWRFRIAMPEFVHREGIGRPKKPCGTVASMHVLTFFLDVPMPSLAKHGDYSCTSPFIRWTTTGAWRRCSLCIARSSGGLKILIGP